MKVKFSNTVNKAPPKLQVSTAGPVQEGSTIERRLQPLRWSKITRSYQSGFEARLLSTVQHCVNIITRSIAGMRMTHVNADNERADSVINEILAYPSGRIPFLFLETLMTHVLLAGNAFIRIQRKGLEVVSLELLKPYTVEIVTLKNGSVKYKVDHMRRYVSDENMIHIVALPKFDNGNSHDRAGVSPLFYGSEVVQLGLQAVQVAKGFYENGCHPSTVISIEGGTAAGQRNKEETKTELDKMTGTAGAGQVLTVPGAVKLHQLSTNLADAQLKEMFEIVTLEVAKLLDVPPVFAYDINSQFTNLQQQNLRLLTHTLMPYVRKIEQEFTHKILLPSQRKAGEKINLDTDFLQRGDSAAMIEQATKASGGPITSTNEARKMVGLNKLSEDDLKKLYTISGTKTQGELNNNQNEE